MKKFDVANDGQRELFGTQKRLSAAFTSSRESFSVAGP